MKVVFDPILGELRMQDSGDSTTTVTEALDIREVDHLPEEGEQGVVYRVADADGVTGNEWIEYYWTGSAWEQFGTDSAFAWGKF